MRKHLRAILQRLTPCVGFALLCVGAYLMSRKLKYTDVSCVLMSCGFLAIFSGIAWTIFQHVKSKAIQRRRTHQQTIQVYTIESRRPSSFPPSYEDSQRCRQQPEADPEYEEVVRDEVQVFLSLAPPLYSQDDTQNPDCTCSWEQPPFYEDSSFATCR
ncbi:transmembrane protein 252-like [Vanacampus margaritifer]